MTLRVAHFSVSDDDGMTNDNVQVLSGLSGVSAYPFGTILQEAGNKKRRELDYGKWTTETDKQSMARKLSGEGGLQVRSGVPGTIKSFCLRN
jgi:hypothetical protein